MIKRALLALMLFASSAMAQSTGYVDAAVAAEGSGTSWATAFKTMSNAISKITGSVTGVLYVAQGTYTVFPSGGMTVSNQAIYGGYPAGGGTRDPVANQTIFDGQSSNRVFNKNGTGLFVLDGIYGVNGSNSPGGFITKSSGDVSFNQCQFTNNTASNLGGFMQVAGAGIHSFSNCVFIGNYTVSLHGGCINFGVSSTNTFINCSFVTNRTTSGYSGCMNDQAACVNYYIGCGFTNNHAANAGCIYVQGKIATTNCSFSENYTAGNGGVVLSTGPVVSDSCYFYGNDSAGSGGALLIQNGPTSSFVNCTFVTNSAPVSTSSGGAIYTGTGNLTVSGSSFSNNYSGLTGGSIYSQADSLQVTDSSFVGNSSTNSSAGAIYHSRVGATTVVTRTSFAGNSSKTTGGAVCFAGSVTGSFINCTFFTNKATTAGGAINCDSACVFGMSNNIFWKQAATTTGTNIDNNGGTIYTAYSDINTNSGMIRGTQINSYGIWFSDPLFADETTYDLHPKSLYGRWNWSTWVYDTVHSPTIDSGCIACPFGSEPQPHGYRVNMGNYGNSAEASKGYNRTWAMIKGCTNAIWYDPYASSLIFWLPFARTTTVTTVNEGTLGSSYNATNVNNTSRVTIGTNQNGRVKYGYTFNGSTDHFIAPPINNCTNVFTIVSWLKGNSTANASIIGRWIASPVTSRTWVQYFGRDMSDYLQSAILYSGTNFITEYPLTATPDWNVWRQYAMVADGSRLKIYTNGVSISTTGAVYSGVINTSSTTPTYIGALDAAGLYAYGGTIGEIKIYNAVLTSNELVTLSQKTHPTNDVQYGY